MTNASRDRNHADSPDSERGTPSSGIANLSHFGLIRFAGEDAQAFLQGQLSCDVHALQTGQALYGSYNTAKGRMLASFLLWRDDAGYVMQLPRSLCEPIRKRLSMYILRSKVKALDASEDYVLLGIAGTDTASLLAPLFKTIPSTALAMSATAGAQLLRLDATHRAKFLFRVRTNPFV